MKTNLRSVDLNLLIVFDAIMIESSLSAAARRLGMTQPAVSNALGRLRLTFDDELFVRTRYGMIPSSRALELITPIREALNIIQDTVDIHRIFDPMKSERVYNLAMTDYGEVTLLPALLNVLEQASDTLSIDAHSALDESAVEQLFQGRMDFIVDFVKSKDDRLGYASMAEDCLVVIAAKNHPRIGNKISSKQFFDERHVVIKHRYDHKTILENIIGEKYAPRKILAQVKQYHSMPHIISETEALGLTSVGEAKKMEKTFAIKSLPLPFKMKKVPYYLIWNKAVENDPGHLWLRQKILGDEVAGKCFNRE